MKGWYGCLKLPRMRYLFEVLVPDFECVLCTLQAVENLFSRAVSTEGTRMLSQECKALKETLQRGFQSKRMVCVWCERRLLCSVCVCGFLTTLSQWYSCCIPQEVEKLQQKAEMEAQQKEMERKLEQFRKEAESAKQRVEERERELRMERERREREREERERDRARVQYALLPVSGFPLSPRLPFPRDRSVVRGPTRPLWLTPVIVSRAEFLFSRANVLHLVSGKSQLLQQSWFLVLIHAIVPGSSFR